MVKFIKETTDEIIMDNEQIKAYIRFLNEGIDREGRQLDFRIDLDGQNMMYKGKPIVDELGNNIKITKWLK